MLYLLVLLQLIGIGRNGIKTSAVLKRCRISDMIILNTNPSLLLVYVIISSNFMAVSLPACLNVNEKSDFGV